MAQSAPIKVYRLGYVSASVFAREVGDDQRLLHSVSLKKRYLDDDGNAKYTSSFDLAELPLATRVLALAQNYIERHEAAVDLD